MCHKNQLIKNMTHLFTSKSSYFTMTMHSLKYIIILKRFLFCFSIICAFSSVLYNDLYLNSYIAFIALSLCSSISLIFLFSCKRLSLIPLDLSILCLILTQTLLLIIKGELDLHYQPLLKIGILLLWMITLRNLCKNDYKRMRKYVFNIFFSWLSLETLFALCNFTIHRVYNSVIFSIFISILIAFLTIYISNTAINKYKQKLATSVLIVLNIAIAYYFESRTAFIVIIITLLLLIRKVYAVKLPLFIGALVIVTCILIISFTFKIDSSYGRILIWRNSLNILTDNWLWGIGLNRFPRVYMEYQQSFLNSLSCYDKYFTLAGNTSFAYNDLIEFTCKFGFIPILGISICFFYSYSIGKRINIDIMFILVLIFIVSLFNYFLQILYCQLFTIVLISCLKSTNNKFRYRIKDFKILTVSIVFLLGSILIYFFKYYSYRFVIKSQQVADSNITWILDDNPNYWWIYANLSFSQHRYHSTIYALNNMSNYTKNSDSECLYAKSYQELNQYILAEKHFRNAIEMYPSKYSCRYDLMLLYKSTGQYDEGALIAKEIIKMPQKVPTGLSFFIIKSAKEYLIKYENQEFAN